MEQMVMTIQEMGMATYSREYNQYCWILSLTLHPCIWKDKIKGITKSRHKHEESTGK